MWRAGVGHESGQENMELVCCRPLLGLRGSAEGGAAAQGKAILPRRLTTSRRRQRRQAAAGGPAQGLTVRVHSEEVRPLEVHAAKHQRRTHVALRMRIHGAQSSFAENVLNKTYTEGAC